MKVSKMKKILQIKHFNNSKIQPQLVDQEERFAFAQFIDNMTYVLQIVEGDVPFFFFFFFTIWT